MSPQTKPFEGLQLFLLITKPFIKLCYPINSHEVYNTVSKCQTISSAIFALIIGTWLDFLHLQRLVDIHGIVGGVHHCYSSTLDHQQFVEQNHRGA